MRTSARRALAFTEGLTLEAFREDLKTQDAVVYRIGVLGEAARHISPETTARLPLDWMAIRSMRNRLFHGYRELRVDIVWATVVDDLPPLVAAIERFLEDRP